MFNRMIAQSLSLALIVVRGKTIDHANRILAVSA